ncbi:MAG TPA: nucleoside hydrolase [Cyclobacteriaceae bacterium]|nr:nucleoside hydrolase [Cyclobacteriaceae bacterium]
MRWIVLLFFVLQFNPGHGQKPVSIIFDTDIAPDYDDVGALTLLHAFADQGEVNLLATISCNTFETTVPTLSVINTYFRRADLPVGVTKGSFPNQDCSQEWAQFINGRYPHALKSNDQAEDAVVLYRKTLAAQPDHSVTIVSVGFFTNLANLLNSKPDAYSSLNGNALVKKKVRQLVSMAASLGKDGNGGKEFNVAIDAKASQKVFDEWPTPMVLSGFEIGEKVLTGIKLISKESIQNSPVKDAFKVALEKDKNTSGRNSWDQTAVLVAVKGLEPYFGYRKINLQIMDDGKSVLIPGNKFTYITFKQTPEQVAKVIEELMMHQPVN